MSEKKKNKGWNNLRTKENSFALYDPERLREVSRKGAQATQKLRAEKKTARQALGKILSMSVTDEILYRSDLAPELAERLKNEYPDATLYDLMQLVALGQALGGDMRACEYVRDTFGDKPSNKIDVASNTVTTDADRELLKILSERLNDPNIQIVADCTVKKGEDNGTNDNENSTR